LVESGGTQTARKRTFKAAFVAFMYVGSAPAYISVML
jgi:hypothetical protein